MISTVEQVEPLLALIRRHESRDDYDIVWGGIRAPDRPPLRLSSMTIRGVLDWQDRIDHKYMSEAAGAYQIMEDTLREIYAPAGLTLDNLFDRQNQNLLAVFLLKRRGLTKFLRGDITAESFANAVAKEWASFPVIGGKNHGKSYYAGDGLNAAHAKPAEVLAALRECMAIDQTILPPPPDVPPPPKSPPVAVPPKASLFGALLAAILSLFRSEK